MTTTQHATLSITGLDCADCAAKLEHGISQIKGIQSAALCFAASTLDLEYDVRSVGLFAVLRRVREMGYDVAGGTELTFNLEGLDCADCAAKLEHAILTLPGVLEAQVVFATSQMLVRAVSADGLRQAVTQRSAELGYQAHPRPDVSSEPAPEPREWRAYLLQRRRGILTAASGAFLFLAMALRALHVAESAVIPLFALAILTGGYYIARSGWAALRTTHSPDMNALMSIAAIGAMFIGEWEEGATAMFLFSLGNMLETLSMDKARQAIRELIKLSPREATRIRGEHSDRVPIDRLRIGDLVEVKPGERVPMDGAVEQGRSALNQAPITGESTPIDAQPGSSIYAGSINGHGALLVRVTKLAADNTLARIVQMVQEAQARRAPAQRFVDQFATYYTPSVLALAVAVAILPPLVLGDPLSRWFYRALVLLVISCPCALVISTPVAIVSAISSAARRGVLIKGGTHLESIGRVRVVAFDKTGTLTEGRPAVTDIVPLDGSIEVTLLGEHPSGCVHTVEGLLTLAASIEAHSQHPVAKAVTEEARQRGLALLPVSDYQELPGRGAQGRIGDRAYYVGSHSLFQELIPHAVVVCNQVEHLEAQGKTTILLGDQSQVLGIIAVADRVRSASAKVVSELRGLGIRKIVMLSGDNERTAWAIAREAGVDDVRANLLPQDKVSAIELLIKESGNAAMVGDGINDAPALARAGVGIAMGAAGADAALETADIVLMADDLSRIPYVVRLGRRTLARIKENIALSLLIKGIFLALAVAGVATLWMAVFADMGTSLLVTFNGMRLLGEKPKG
jgi:Cd2+/Zn2+-exporting ATPase